MTKLHSITLAAALAVATAGAHAVVGADEAAKLGKTLTPMGAEQAGNAAGTIPPWDGGLTKAPPGYKEGSPYPDPYAQDKALFTIDASNVERYKANLTPGQVEMIKRYPTWKMAVYPTRRSASFPEAHYRETTANATRVKLADGGNGAVGSKGGVPFPIPRDGLEAIWNHLMRYRGDSYAMTWSQAAVTRDGNYTLVRLEYEYDFHYGNASKPEPEREDNKLFHFLQTVTAPARLAGQILLVHEYADQVKSPRQAWTYNPGQRRVRLAPNVAYDNPGTASDGLRTNDDFFMYNGATDRYEWKLVGKREVYIPYNAYKLNGNGVKYSDVIRPRHLNPDLTRYELHRVWVVEATVRPGTSHLYARRTFYIDEDSWAVAVVDKYDARGQLWRVGEMHPINFYNVPMHYPAMEVHHDLLSDRYIVMGLRNEEPKVYERISRRAADFAPSGLRAVGTR